MSLMARLLAATFTISLSVVLGIVLLVIVALFFPEFVETLLDGAGWLNRQITGNDFLDPEINVWVRFLLEDRQFVVLGFVIFTRIVMALVYGLGMQIYAISRKAMQPKHRSELGSRPIRLG